MLKPIVAEPWLAYYVRRIKLSGGSKVAITHCRHDELNVVSDVVARFETAHMAERLIEKLDIIIQI